MFKILVIQVLNNLSDERTEYLINDRLSFYAFPWSGAVGPGTGCQNGLALSRASDTGGCDQWLFNRFDVTLRNAGYLPMSGQILDATLVAALKQRNTNAEKVDLREGRIPQD
ncbi:transposase [Acetobacter indonesiensis NRIC 0313]|uniref:Transposase n=1 Tax=Acetobacter indonesiensis TaxID=104101 RepID=A0A6N3T5Q0_9PROT|nr:transposase [Acetobacter indonesiensis]GBQ54206.1 transposase [Acetobacter indonesiensis NRIC 0313]GEN03238.1 hypothetical protein AIN02nite_12630 [Acetobacter indonesiensis]